MNIQLSIIIPAYNAQNYLDACLNSILQQYFDEGQIEVIVIDDGSNDATATIADQWAQKESYIHVIHQENQGLSAARNRGIKEANGEYLLFLDSDDLLAENTVKDLLKLAIDNQLDALRYQCELVEEDGSKKFLLGTSEGPRLTLMSGAQFMANQHQIRCYACLYITRRAMVVNECTLWFVPNLLYEDVEWTPRMLACVKRMMVVDTIVYQYVQHDNSITHSYSPEKVKQLLDSHKQIVKHLMQQREAHPFGWYDKIMWGMCESALTLTGKYLYPCRKEICEWAQGVLDSLSVKEMSMTKSERIKSLLIHLSPALYCWLRHIL